MIDKKVKKKWVKKWLKQKRPKSGQTMGKKWLKMGKQIGENAGCLLSRDLMKEHVMSRISILKFCQIP